MRRKQRRKTLIDDISKLGIDPKSIALGEFEEGDDCAAQVEFALLRDVSLKGVSTAEQGRENAHKIINGLEGRKKLLEAISDGLKGLIPVQGTSGEQAVLSKILNWSAKSVFLDKTFSKKEEEIGQLLKSMFKRIDDLREFGKNLEPCTKLLEDVSTQNSFAQRFLDAMNGVIGTFAEAAQRAKKGVDEDAVSSLAILFAGCLLAGVPVAEKSLHLMSRDTGGLLVFPETDNADREGHEYVRYCVALNCAYKEMILGPEMTIHVEKTTIHDKTLDRDTVMML